jgi:hypothetical protein
MNVPSEAVTGATVGGGPRQGTTAIHGSKYIQFSLLEGWRGSELSTYLSDEIMRSGPV